MLGVGLCLVLCWALQGYATTITLQNGVNGYTGTDDNTLHALTNDGSTGRENWNLGAYNQILVTGTPWVVDQSGSMWQNTGLLRFNNISGTGGAIPAGQTITSAKIQLKVASVNQNGSGSWLNVKMSPMLVDWAEGTKNATTATAGESCFMWRSYNTQQWGSATKGPQGGTDYNNTTGPVVTFNAANVTVEYDVTSMVQAWYAGTPNYGVYLYGINSYYAAANIASSEDATVANRPALVIDYVPVPEPATIALISLGGLFLLRRKSINA